MDKNTIIAVILSLLVWVGWYYFFGDNKQEKAVPAQQSLVQTDPQQNSQQNAAVQSAVEVQKSQIIKPALNKETVEKKHNFSTNIYEAVISNKGASVESLKYGSRKIEVVVAGKDGLPGRTFDFPLTFNENEFLSGNDFSKELWSVIEQSDDSITFGLSAVFSNSEVLITKKFKFIKDQHYFDLEYNITNMSSNNVLFPGNSLIVSAPAFLGPEMTDYKIYANELFPIYKKDDSMEKGSKGGGFFSTEMNIKTDSGQIKWAGVSSRYFVAVLLPSENSKASKIIYDARGNSEFSCAFVYNDSGIPANATITKTYKVCVSEKRKDTLSSVDPTLIEAMDVNKWIEPIRFAVIWCLAWLNKYIANFGLCIILFSIITKVIFLPLTMKSTNSMKKMSELGPEIKKLQEKYKDKPDLIQKETMKLYKAKGVNPMTSCLPILVQMPFFIALYSALSNTLDMWNQPFVFWMTDLSMPDTVFSMMGFNLNILPLVMTGTSFVMQKMSTVDTSSNPQQKMMMNMMPVILIFVFWNMPSGLIIYWIMQNILQIAHQYYVNKRTTKKAS